MELKVACESDDDFSCVFDLDYLVATVNAENELKITFYYGFNEHNLLIKDNDNFTQYLFSYIKSNKKQIEIIDI